jgi:hypothetical protein
MRTHVQKHSGISDAERRWRSDQKTWIDSFVKRMRQDGCIRDTNTALFTRSLAQILARPFDRRYPALIAETMMERGEPVDVAAASVISQGHEVFGEATVTSTYQTEVATVQVQGHEQAIVMYGVLAKFFIGYQQIRAAAMAGVPLSMKLADAAYRVVATTKDVCLSTGNAGAGFTGMINNVSVGVVQGAVTLIPVATTGLWDAVATTDANIIQDVNLLKAWAERTSIYKMTDLAVAPTDYGRLITPTTAAGYSPNLKTVIENSFGLKVSEWPRLAGAAITGAPANRAILYEKSVDVFNPLVAPGPEQFPPVQTDTGYSVTVHQRIGGVDCMNPLGALYFDMA